LLGGQNVAAVVAGVGFFAFFALMFPLVLLLWYLHPALTVHYLRTGRVTAGLEIPTIFRIAFSGWDYLEVFLYMFVVSVVANFVGQFLFCLVFCVVAWSLY